MKRFIWIFLLALLLGHSPFAKAALWDRGGGLIYDDVLNVTWLQDANYAGTLGLGNGGTMNLGEALTWVADLSYYDSARGKYWNDWWLPRALPVDGSSYDYDLTYDGSTDIGYNISALGSAHPGSTGSEMAYMYYINLGNTSYICRI